MTDRNPANSRIYPASNIAESGTRKEEKLLDERTLAANRTIRRHLAGAFAEPLPKALVPGRPTTVRLTVQDLGNVPAHGPANIALSAAIHGPPGTSPVALATVPVKLNLKPGAGKRYRLRFTAPADLPFGPAILGAVIDPDNRFADTNVANNTFYSTRQVPGG
jgi:hypothetical protein